MRHEKICPECDTSRPIEDFVRRPGQPYFLQAGRAWPTEPLVEQVEMAVCCVCFGLSVIKESNGSEA